MKENSYTELMKSSAMKQKKLKESFMQDLYIDMTLAEILLNSERDQLIARMIKPLMIVIKKHLNCYHINTKN